MRSRILETILCTRFFFFQYGVVYHLNAANGSTSLTVSHDLCPSHSLIFLGIFLDSNLLVLNSQLNYETPHVGIWAIMGCSWSHCLDIQGNK